MNVYQEPADFLPVHIVLKNRMEFDRMCFLVGSMQSQLEYRKDLSAAEAGMSILVKQLREQLDSLDLGDRQ